MERGTFLSQPCFQLNVALPFQNILSRAHGIRSLGSACMNMVMVAGGNADAYQEFGLHCWDMAAAKLIVEEAGGVVMDMNGKWQQHYLA